MHTPPRLRAFLYWTKLEGAWMRSRGGKPASSLPQLSGLLPDRCVCCFHPNHVSLPRDLAVAFCLSTLLACNSCHSCCAFSFHHFHVRAVVFQAPPKNSCYSFLHACLTIGCRIPRAICLQTSCMFANKRGGAAVASSLAA